MGEASPKPPLEYDRTATTVTVRGFRTLIVLLVINTLMLGWFIATPGASRFVQSQWRQWQNRREQRKAEQAALAVQQKCLTHTFPPDLVVYEERRDAIARLLATGEPYRSISSDAGRDTTERPIQLDAFPAHWLTLAGQTNHEDVRTPLVFLHERVIASGERRLVAAQWSAESAFGGSGMRVVRRRLNITTFTPGVVGRLAERRAGRAVPLKVRDEQPLSQHGRIGTGPALTLLPGQPDPADASHFTIPYLIDGRPGVIDVWLRDDVVEVKARTGRPTFVDGETGWELDAPSTTTTNTTAPSNR